MNGKLSARTAIVLVPPFSVLTPPRSRISAGLGPRCEDLGAQPVHAGPARRGDLL
jgi:hypothetical protein